MKTDLLGRIGDWNPQLYRELKGQLKLPLLILTLATSLFFQFLLVVNNASYSLEEGGVWELDWGQIFYLFNCLLPVAAIASGVYLLAADLCREKIRGTLNFLCLTPQSSEKILLGKLLGVPLFIYWGSALALPLYFYAAFLNQPPLLSLLILCLFWVGVGSISYKAALLLSLKANERNHRLLPIAIAASNLVAIVALILYLLPNSLPDIYLDLPQSSYYRIKDNLIFVNFRLLALLFAIDLWTWQILNRHFYSLERTLIAKSQSYGMVGFAVLWSLTTPFINSEDWDFYYLTMSLADSPILLYLIISLAIFITPSRPATIERGRNLLLQNLGKRERLRELFLGENSPAPAAIALNLALIGALWLPLYLLDASQRRFHDLTSRFPLFSIELEVTIFLSLFLKATLLLIYATLYQSIRFQNRKIKRELIISSVWTGTILFPFVFFAISLVLNHFLGQQDTVYSSLFSTFSVDCLRLFTPFTLHNDSGCYNIELLLALTIQLGILGLLKRRIQQQIKDAIES